MVTVMTVLWAILGLSINFNVKFIKLRAALD